MQKLLFSFIFFSFILSCSKPQNNNSGTTNMAVPIAPTNLNCIVRNVIQVNLTWTDNATDEYGYRIERKTGSGAYVLLASTGVNTNQYTDSSVSVNNTYTYRVYAYNSAGSTSQSSNECTVVINPVSVVLPTLSTTAASSITSSSALSGGYITSDGGASIISRGIIWSTTTNPTVSLATKTNDGSGIGAFTSSILILNANTTYFVRAYATNIIGTSYGDVKTFTTTTNSFTIGPNIIDINGNTYHTIVTGCGQSWTSNNLVVSNYRNGDPIPEVTNSTTWNLCMSSGLGAWCWYNNDSINYSQYGKLYNWFAVNDSRGLAPNGWRVPGLNDWTALENCLGGTTIAGGLMKEIGTVHWNSPNTGATNSSGFSGLPSGYRTLGGQFLDFGNYGNYWTTAEGTSSAWFRGLGYNYADLNINSMAKTSGFSVRIVKN